MKNKINFNKINKINKITKKDCSVCLEEKLVYKCDQCTFCICSKCYIKFNKKTCGVCGLEDFSEICKLFSCYKCVDKSSRKLITKTNKMNPEDNKDKGDKKIIKFDNIAFENPEFCYKNHEKGCIQCCKTYKWGYKEDEYVKLNPKRICSGMSGMGSLVYPKGGNIMQIVAYGAPDIHLP